MPALSISTEELLDPVQKMLEGTVHANLMSSLSSELPPETGDRQNGSIRIPTNRVGNSALKSNRTHTSLFAGYTASCQGYKG